ncbi:hypothetical protein JHK87_051039 [Glycine soja]|nr:hypothetical protein JHK87_051039 [Glycine soja]
MKVFLCEMIVEIVAENGEEKVQEIEFRQLKSLELVSLKNLTSFSSSEKCDFKFPLLESLVVSECPQMKKFSKVQSAPNLKKVHVVAGEKDKWYWEGDLNDTLQKHFTHQVYRQCVFCLNKLSEIEWHERRKNGNVLLASQRKNVESIMQYSLYSHNDSSG